jgi:hypothetical protein
VFRIGLLRVTILPRRGWEDAGAPVHALCALEESKLIGIIIGPRRMPISHACSMEWIGSYREVLRVDRPLLWRIMIVEMQ